MSFASDKQARTDGVTGTAPTSRAISAAAVSAVNAPLIEAENSRWQLSTPCLVLDLDAFERNILQMKSIAETAGLALRPHVKTHKCSMVAQRQIAAGAIGVCCATLDEAAVMIGAGIPGVHVTSPSSGAQKVRQLVGLARRAPDLMAIVDHPENLHDIDRAAGKAGLCINILVDIDPGMDRTGVASDAELHELVRLADAAENLTYRGIQCYHGNLQHIEDAKERRAAVDLIGRRIQRLSDELTRAGLKPDIVSGGGTGSAQMETARVFTELQVGSYAMMDVEYARVRVDDTRTLPFDPALFVSATVVNSHRNGQSTIDAGTKAVARGWSMPTLAVPRDTGISYEFSGDEHGRLVYPGKTNEQLPPGSRVELFVPHCDPNVDLYAFYHCVLGDRLVDIWPVDARSNR